MLDGRFHLKIQADRLVITDPPLATQFQTAADDVTRNGGMYNVALPLPSDASGRRALMHLAMATAEDVETEAGSRPVLIGIISFARELEPQELARLREAFGLSEAEAEIAALILAGCSPREIARRRGSSVQTIRWHIKNIHSKTHTRRLTDLVLQIQAVRSPF
jgi:DNA-binding CsgD family transcriptional regulator